MNLEFTLTDGSVQPRNESGTWFRGHAADAVTTFLFQAQSADVFQLPAVAVGAEGESATGPVNGFLAKRSVSATKTTTDLVETPQAVTVISNDRLTTLNTHYTAGVSD